MISLENSVCFPNEYRSAGCVKCPLLSAWVSIVRSVFIELKSSELYKIKKSSNSRWIVPGGKLAVEVKKQNQLMTIIKLVLYHYKFSRVTVFESLKNTGILCLLTTWRIENDTL